MNILKSTVVIILCALIVGSLTLFISPQATVEMTEKKEQQPASTKEKVGKIVKKHLIENAILSIQVTPLTNKEQVVLILQTTEFLTEDVLQHNTYNMMQDFRSINNIQFITITWHMMVKGENTAVLTMAFDEDALKQTNTIAAADLPSIATDYIKHTELAQSR